MRFLVMIAFLFSASLSFAEPLPLSGTYQFRGRVEALTRRTYDTVNLRFPGAKERLQLLQAQGAQCQAVPGGIYRCITYRTAADVPTASLQKSAQKNRGLRLEMGVLRGPPSLVTNGTDIRQWEVPQSGSWNLSKFDAYTYYERREAMSKLVLPGLEAGLWLNVESPLRLRLYDEVVTSEGEFRWHTDAVEAILEK